MEKWQQWDVDPIPESRYNIKRVKGELPEMESTKQLVNLISEVYRPKMKVLDVGCNVGHYLSGIRKKFFDLDYTGVDAYDFYIKTAQAHCFLRSWLLPGSIFMLIFMFFLCFLQAGSLPKSLFLSVGTFMDLPKLIQNTFETFHENMFFEVSEVILTSF